MAIEWNVYGPEPVGRLALIEASVRIAGRLVGEGSLDFALSLAAAGRAEDGAEFDGEVCAVFGEAVALVDVYAGRMEDEGVADERDLPLAGTVTARRTVFSAALGLAVALAWLEAGGGQLDGPGLDRAIRRADLDAVLGAVSDPTATGIAAVERLGRRVVGAGAAMPFS